MPYTDQRSLQLLMDSNLSRHLLTYLLIYFIFSTVALMLLCCVTCVCRLSVCRLYKECIISSQSPTKFSRPANLHSLQNNVEPAPRLLSPQLDHLYLPHYKSPTAPLDICITSPVESTPFFIPSTSLCSLSSWFTSSCAYHLITVITFALTIYHSLSLSLQTQNSSLSQILSSIVTLIPSGLTSLLCFLCFLSCFPLQLSPSVL